MKREQVQEILSPEILAQLQDRDIISAILTWENNEFTEKALRNVLEVNSKEVNINILLNKLEERFDWYVITFLKFLPAYYKSSDLKGDLNDIKNDVFKKFQLTIKASEAELNRKQVVAIITDKQRKQDIYGYIDEQLIENEFVKDEEIETLSDEIFFAVLFELLYSTEQPLTLQDLC